MANIMNDIKESQSEFGNTLSDFKIITELGRGSYGIAYKVQAVKDNNNIYVLKKIPIKHMKQKHQREALQEVLILKNLKHPNIIRYYASFIEADSLFILMEYAAGGDLYAVRNYLFILY